MADYKKYAQMGDVNPNATVYEPKDEVAWEDEFFHSIYIGGKTRVEEKIGNKKLFGGMLHIRGVSYNMDEVYIKPFYKRQILNNEVKNGKYDSTKCFSYAERDEEGNQLSTSGFFCPQTSLERKEIHWCSTCRTSIIIAGFLCDEIGKYILTEDGKPIHVFVKGTGSKVGDLMQYVFVSKDYDIPFLFPDVATDESNQQESSYFNIFRKIIKITVDEVPVYKSDNTPIDAKNRYAYKLEGGEDLSRDMIFKLLDYSQKIDDDLKAKFDYTENTLKNASKYFKQQLKTFQNSDMFKNVNPKFVPQETTLQNSASNFMTIDEPSIPQATSPASSPPDNVLNDSMGIDDIPF